MASVLRPRDGTAYECSTSPMRLIYDIHPLPVESCLLLPSLATALTQGTVAPRQLIIPTAALCPYLFGHPPLLTTHSGPHPTPPPPPDCSRLPGWPLLTSLCSPARSVLPGALLYLFICILSFQLAFTSSQRPKPRVTSICRLDCRQHPPLFL